MVAMVGNKKTLLPCCCTRTPWIFIQHTYMYRFVVLLLLPLLLFLFLQTVSNVQVLWQMFLLLFGLWFIFGFLCVDREPTAGKNSNYSISLHLIRRLRHQCANNNQLLFTLNFTYDQSLSAYYIEQFATSWDSSVI